MRICNAHVIDERCSKEEDAIYSNTMFNVTRILILDTIIKKPNSNIKDIIQVTGISKDRMYHELNVLKSIGIITTTEFHTKSGFKKKGYKVNYNQYHLLWTKTTD